MKNYYHKPAGPNAIEVVVDSEQECQDFHFVKTFTRNTMKLYTKEMSLLKNYLRQYSGLDKECQCYQCGDLFQSRGWALYCSLRCKNDAAIHRRRNIKPPPQPLKKCMVCKGSFSPKRSDQKYCSNACKQKQYRTKGRSATTRLPNGTTSTRLPTGTASTRLPTGTALPKQRSPINRIAAIAWHQRVSVDSVYKTKYIIKWADPETLQMLEDEKISVHKAWKKAKANEYRKVLEVIALNQDDK